MNRMLFPLLLVAAILTGCSKDNKTERLTVASETGDCFGVMPQKCLLIKHEGDQNWEYWYEQIQGFDYEPGYEYVIKVRREKVDAGMADRSSFRYVLDKVVSKDRKVSENLPARADEVIPVGVYYEEVDFIVPADSSAF